MMSVKKDDKRNTNIGGTKYKTNDFEILEGSCLGSGQLSLLGKTSYIGVYIKGF